MANEQEIGDPKKVFYYSDENGNEWLGIDVRGCRLATTERVWVRTYRPRRGGDLIPAPPLDFVSEMSVRFPHLPEIILQRKPRSNDRPLNDDPETVWFGLDIHKMIQHVSKDLNTIRFLLIPCDLLEAAKIPGFEQGCTPRTA